MSSFFIRIDLADDTALPGVIEAISAERHAVPLAVYKLRDESKRYKGDDPNYHGASHLYAALQRHFFAELSDRRQTRTFNFSELHRIHYQLYRMGDLTLDDTVHAAEELVRLGILTKRLDPARSNLWLFNLVDPLYAELPHDVV